MCMRERERACVYVCTHVSVRACMFVQCIQVCVRACVRVVGKSRKCVYK